MNNEAVAKNQSSRGIDALQIHMNRSIPYCRCKRGWNWYFTVGETTRNGNAITIVRRELLWRSKSSLDTIVSGYPHGLGHREDAVIEAICETIGNLYADGYENDVAIEEVNGRNFDSIIIGTSIDSEIVQEFARALSAIRRVIVDC